MDGWKTSFSFGMAYFRFHVSFLGWCILYKTVGTNFHPNAEVTFDLWMAVWFDLCLNMPSNRTPKLLPQNVRYAHEDKDRTCLLKKRQWFWDLNLGGGHIQMCWNWKEKALCCRFLCMFRWTSINPVRHYSTHIDDMGKYAVFVLQAGIFSSYLNGFICCAEVFCLPCWSKSMERLSLVVANMGFFGAIFVEIHVTKMVGIQTFWFRK